MRTILTPADGGFRTKGDDLINAWSTPRKLTNIGSDILDLAIP